MWPYYAIALLIMILQLKFSKEDKKQIKLKFAFTILFLFAALRGNGDGDYFNYLEYSTYVTSIKDVINKNIPMEIGFRAISYIKNGLNLNSQWVIISMNLISLVSIYTLIKRYSGNKLLSTLSFLPMYFQYDMHAARTAVAIGIGSLSIKYIEERKFMKFLTIVLLATTFHKSAIILIPLYFMGNININKYIGIASIGFLTILTSVISIDSTIIKVLSTIRLNSYARKFASYSQSIRFGYPYRLYDPRLILAVGIYILARLIIKKPTKTQNIFINASLFNVLLILFFREHTVFVNRLACYYEIFNIISVTYILNELNKKKNIAFYGLTSLTALYTYSLYIIALITKTVRVDYKMFF